MKSRIAEHEAADKGYGPVRTGAVQATLLYGLVRDDAEKLDVLPDGSPPSREATLLPRVDRRAA
jgi:hypothetical protein